MIICKSEYEAKLEAAWSMLNVMDIVGVKIISLENGTWGVIRELNVPEMSE